jgi:transposase
MSDPGAATLLPDASQLRLLCIDGLDAAPTGLVLTVAAKARAARCPGCGERSRRVHSRYGRTVRDLPWGELPVRLRLRVRRFFCDAPACPRRIFTERLPGVVAPYARRTDRLAAWLTRVAFALGGEPGARLLGHQRLPLSGDTLLRRIRATALPAGPPPRVLSVDDFAFRRGRTYGSILVDLERHRVVDLLPDRQAATFAAWLGARPPPRVLSRDRGGEYALGGRQGAPEAVQVADRFHLLKNVGEAAERVLRRHAAAPRRVPAPPPPAPGGAAPPKDGEVGWPALWRELRRAERDRRDRRASRARTQQEVDARFAAIQAGAARGLNTSAIARAVGAHRHTVQKYLALPAAPAREYTARRPSILAPYVGYLLERWRQGERQALALWRELAAQGYPGRYRQVARFVAALRRRDRAGRAGRAGRRGPAPAELAPPAGLTPKRARGLLLARPAARTPEEQATVTRLPALHPDLRAAVGLLDGFARLLRDTSGAPPAQRWAQLEQWLAAAASSGLPEFEAFAVKARQDLWAVAAALILPYSQGQTEGQVNRLKALKRAMYGRAKFDLLRQRVLYAAA